MFNSCFEFYYKQFPNVDGSSPTTNFIDDTNKTVIYTRKWFLLYVLIFEYIQFEELDNREIPSSMRGLCL